jgi:hypothetical protein
MSQVLFGILLTNGQIAILEPLRWTEKGGSYRTIQYLYYSILPWNRDCFYIGKNGLRIKAFPGRPASLPENNPMKRGET